MANDVEINDRRVRYIATAGQTIFDIDFPIFTTSDLAVSINNNPTVAYTVNIIDEHIILTTGANAGDIVVIEGNTQPIRETSYPTSGALRSNLLNLDIRRLLYIAQELRTAVGRVMSLAQNEVVGISLRLPKAETGKMLKWGPDGLVNSDSNIDDLDDAVNAAEAAQMEAESAAAAADASAIAANLSKQAAEAAAAGMKWRGSVKVSTTVNIVLSGTQTINGVAVVAGDLVLVWNQTTPSQNGVYVVATGAWSRANYADTWTELVGMVVTTEQGVADADTPFICIVNSGGTLGSTAVTFTYLPSPVIDGGISRAAQIVAGILNIAHMASSSIATLAELISGATKFITASVLKTYLDNIQNSYIILDTANGSGSTNTYIRRFSNSTLGSYTTDLTYADSPTGGTTITINTDGLYALFYEDQFSATNQLFGISKNSNQLNTAISAITAANRLGMVEQVNNSTPMCLSFTRKFSAGDVLRPHINNATSNGSSPERSIFSIQRVL